MYVIAEPRHPTACTTCAKAKVRCEPSDEGDSICKRCRRLNKECATQTPGAHRRKRARLPEIARLEEKLDGMAAILAASERRTGIIPGTPSPASTVAHGLPPGPITPNTGPYLDRAFSTNPHEAQMVLDIFREEMTPHFPFVVVPPTMTAGKLQQEKPFVYMNVMMAACQHSSSRQLALGEQIRSYLSHRILITGEQSLDLLQGLLIFLACYHIHFQFGSQVTNLLHLTLAMLINLGLNRPTDPRGKTGPPFHFLGHFYNEQQSSRPRTLEEMRAYLGCYHMASMISTCTRDVNGLKHSKYTDECCRMIEEAQEYASDTYLVHLIRLHRVGDKIRRTLWNDRLEMCWNLSAPIGMCVRSLESELQQFKDSIKLNMPQRSLILLHCYTIEISLYGVGLNDQLSGTDYGDYPLTRLDILYSCLAATKSFFDQLAALPLSLCLHLPYTYWAQFGQAVVALSKLSLFNSDGWDQAYARSVVDFAARIDEMKQKFDEFHSAAQAGRSRQYVPEVFTQIGSRLQWMKEVHERKRAAQAEREGPLSAHAANVGLNLDGELPSVPMLDFLDEFWQQLL